MQAPKWRPSCALILFAVANWASNQQGVKIETTETRVGGQTLKTEACHAQRRVSF